jgi:hypothetical protein
MSRTRLPPLKAFSSRVATVLRRWRPGDSVNVVPWGDLAPPSEDADASGRSRTLEIRLTPRAKRALSDVRAPLDFELELYFSCLIRKRINVREAPRVDAAAVGKLSDEVSVSFRPVMTKSCSVNEVVGSPDLDTFPIVNSRAFTPKWLELDHERGRWQGEFGW